MISRQVSASVDNAINTRRVQADWQNGDWHTRLPVDAWQLAQSNPTKNSIYLALRIQHALTGFNTQVLRMASEQLANISSNVRWSKVAIRLLNAHLQMDDTQSAHSIVERYLTGKCSHLNAIRLRRFPMSLRFIYQHYPDKLGASLASKAVVSTSLLEKVQCFDASFLHARRRELPDSHNPTLSVAIVGNGPSLLDSSNGSDIDSHDIVVRFNTPVLNREYRKFTGSRTDLCVISPALGRRSLNPNATRLAVSGINILAGESGYWQHLARACSELSLAVFPQAHWYALVQQLQAPPSAGLLTLSCLAKEASLSIKAYGFSTQTHSAVSQGDDSEVARGDREEGAHYGDALKASSRHNWRAEAELLGQLI